MPRIAVYLRLDIHMRIYLLHAKLASLSIYCSEHHITFSAIPQSPTLLGSILFTIK